MSERVWAVIDGGVVVNAIVADDAFIALISGEHDMVEEVTDLSPRPSVRWTYTKQDGYRSPQPFPSWVWNGTRWDAPMPFPTAPGAWEWDEAAQEWVDTTPPDAE